MKKLSTLTLLFFVLSATSCQEKKNVSFSPQNNESFMSKRPKVVIIQADEFNKQEVNTNK